MSSRGSGARPAADGGGPAEPGPRRPPPGGRAPGAHRANKADGVPGFGRARGRPDHAAGPQAGARTPGLEVPFPADVPSPGEAGLAGDGYGLSAEGELSEVEFIRARLASIQAAAAATSRASSAASAPRAPGRTGEPAAN